MKRVTGIGGVFFKAKNPKGLAQWYETHLGVNIESQQAAATFRWRDHDNPEQSGATVWGLFSETTSYFGSPDARFMINYRVEDLNKLLEQLKKEGVEIAGEPEDTEHGRFAWILDGEGNRIELWEAPDDY